MELLDVEANSLAVLTEISTTLDDWKHVLAPEDSFVSSAGLIWSRYLAKD